MNPEEKRVLAGMIDHTLLRADARVQDIERLCREAEEHRFAAVCVNPCRVAMAARLLDGAAVEVCTVVDFPLGAGTGEMKRFCARRSADEGATELDVVMNVGAFKSGLSDPVEEEIRRVVEDIPEGVLLKVILETCFLGEEEIEAACNLCLRAGAGFVKTSTGFGPGGATLEAVRIMHKAVGGRLGIKAAGGIKDLETARAMIACGATRIGASASLRIIGAG